jgi:DNA-binding GntR family transcriptional regulator
MNDMRPPPSTAYDDTHSKASAVLRRLRTDIVAGLLPPGRKLHLRTLVERYGVGMSPLREALCQLIGEHLVVLRSQRGFSVAPVSVADLADVISARRHAEIYALGLSVEKGDARWRERVQRATDAFSTVAAKVGDPRPIDEHWERIHREYHFALIGACNSPILLGFCKSIYHRFDRYRRIAVPVQSFMAGTARDHRAIAQAAVEGNREYAQKLLAEHIDDIADVIATNFPPVDPMR